LYLNTLSNHLEIKNMSGMGGQQQTHGPGGSLAGGHGPVGAGTADVLHPQILKGLTDKLYEKRKAAALEIEK
jgi:hypothetical protein